MGCAGSRRVAIGRDDVFALENIALERHGPLQIALGPLQASCLSVSVIPENVALAAVALIIPEMDRPLNLPFTWVVMNVNARRKGTGRLGLKLGPT